MPSSPRIREQHATPSSPPRTPPPGTIVNADTDEVTSNDDQHAASVRDDKKHLLTDHPDERRFSTSFPSDPEDHTISSSYYHRSPHMPHRVETLPPMSLNSHRRPYDHPSPPPIATLTHSPALSVTSLDRSSINTPPPPRRSPPNGAMQQPMYSYGVDAQQHRQQQHYNQHSSTRQDGMQAHYNYGMSNYNDHPQYSMPSNGGGQIPGMHQTASSQGRDSYLPYPLPGQANMNIIHTDDAATKLSDRVRRRCFNCCTTDTSTWRRSNLSPGKVLCNKCGLFERTHSKPRPEQFPHKRGPLATSTLRSRTPPQNHLPPIHSHTLPPYHYNHPSIAPLSSSGPEPRRQYSYPSSQHNTPPALPGVQSWLTDPTSSSQSTQPPTARRLTLDSQRERQRPPTPPRAQQPQQQSAPLETHDQPSSDRD
ncbi:hypothetical protein PLEOSDRAFT_168592 [Pleurotus ostreatus PC15]|uniref:GATA-type domain-containing protein n=1 Tax=Pleurotus ostreatus (strain PC15) TaxID=1137138 RepID=A0A067NH57_PLEO1|nr:hypothetical protein PLEOSDRAFT_168592 [Pleurotus ostreatus PC15]